MRRLAAVLLVLALLGGSTRAWAASDNPPPIPDDVQSWADYVGLSPTDLAGAVWTTHSTPEDYLVAEGVVTRAPQPTALGWPIGGALGARLWCIEQYESRHNGGAVNPSSGARGFLQWLPGTARAWGVIVGNRASEWAAASRIAALGEAFFRSQWVALQRGLC